MEHYRQTRPRPRVVDGPTTWTPVMQSSSYIALYHARRQRRPSFDQAFVRNIDRYINEREQERCEVPIIISDDDEQENELASTLPERPPKRRRISNGAVSHLQADAARIANGIATPVTSEAEADTIHVRSRVHPIRAKSSASNTQAVTFLSSDTEESSHGNARPQQRSKKDYRILSDEEATRLESRAISVLSVNSAFPRSAYLSRAEVATFSEHSALEDLYQDLRAATVQDSDLPPIALDDFAIYRPESSSRPLDLVTLNKLRADGSPEFCFDGVLSFGNKHYRVQGVPFSTLSIDGYGEFDSADMTGHIYLQSRLAQRNDIWFQLKSPASEYVRFHQEFIWLASFTRHFAGYLMCHENITLMHFRQQFAEWLAQKYKEDAAYHAWLRYCGRLRDFRDTVAMSIRYIREECYNIDDEATGLLEHPIWGEVDSLRLTAIPEQPNIAKRTVVTPYAMRCFESMYFADQLDLHEVIDRATAARIDKRKVDLKLTPRSSAKTTCRASLPGLSVSPDARLEVYVGDVVSIQAEEGSLWGAGPWYAYVQAIRRIVEGNTVLDIIWLYTPRNTTLANVYYPFPNELFFSDHCECGKDAVDLSDVIEKIRVSWFPKDPHDEAGFFIRQKFRTVEDSDSYDFVDLKSTDYKCQCGNFVSEFENCLTQYAVGDTVLIRERHRRSDVDHLEPAQIIQFDHIKKQVQLRRLARTSTMDSRARPNELSLTSDLLWKGPTKIIRQCHVRYLSSKSIQRADIPTPYDRDGTGDFFYINADNQAGDGLPPLTQGWDPKQKPRRPKLAGMGIYCGGGTFDRGLEEGGAVDFRFAVDWATHALHSHRANVSRPERVKYFLGSVSDLLARAARGDYGDCIARPGEVQLISGGPPCPGFSQMQKDKYSDRSRANASMVASMVSYVDFYSPEYLILENVITMTLPMGANKDQHVFAQIVAALVGLGYQVSQHLVESWSYGSPQRRPRLFIIATAPGLKPLKSPSHSHGHPEDLPVRARSLGTAANGKKFAYRRDDYTPFKCNTAAKSTEDLPNISDAQVGLCARFPDHVTSCTRGSHSNETRNRIAMIPKRPYGMTMFQAAQMGSLRGEPLQFFENSSTLRKRKNSKTYSRVFPNGLFSTVLTAFSVGCAMDGRVLHWDQDRELTVREARRAQGYLDHEVLVGDPRQRLKIIGNSVDRRSALVLGLALRESWLGESRRGRPPSFPVPSASPLVTEQEDSGSNDVTPNDGTSTIETTPAPAPKSLVIDLEPDDEISDDDLMLPDARDDTAMLGEPVVRPMTPERQTIDNRSVKMALNLSPEDIGAIQSGGGFKHIKHLLEQSKLAAASGTLHRHYK